MGITITPEIILAVLGLIGTILGGRAYVSKQNAERDKLAAEAKLKEVEAEAVTSQFILKMIEKQQGNIDRLYETNAQYAEFLREKERKDDSNYRTMKQVIDGHAGYIGSLIVEGHENVMREIRAIPSRIEAVNGDALKALAAEIGEVLRQKLTVENVTRNTYHFPTPDDPEWRDEWVYPLVPDVIMHKGPYYDTDVLLKKPCSEIKSEGEPMKVIVGRYPDWVIVDKLADNIRCWGYIPRNKVRVGREAPVPV